MARSPHACERCGAPALVHITNEAPSGNAAGLMIEGDGRAVVRHMCLACADISEPPVRTHYHFVNYGAIMMSVGALVTGISAFADQLHFGNSDGFGPRQQLALGIASICVFTAALIRVPTLMVVGVLAGGITIAADVLQFGHDPGFGWHQMLGVLVGIVLLVTGWLESRRQT